MLHSLFMNDNQNNEVDTLINSLNTAVTKTATETANDMCVLGQHQPTKKPWVTDDMLKLCDKHTELKQKKNKAEGVKLYREANQ